MITGDWNGDGKPDVFVGASGGMTVFLNAGDGTFLPRRDVGNSFQLGATGYGGSYAIGDVNGDGKPDVVAMGPYPGNAISVLFGNGDGTFTAGPSTGIGYNNGLQVAVGDFNRDGKLDVAVTYAGGSFPATCDLQILLGNGDGTFHLGALYTGMQSGVWVADMNGDGKLDIVTSSQAGSTAQGVNAFTVLLGNGNGGFTALPAVTLYQSPVTIAIGDLNGDGKPDIVASLVNGVQVALGYGDGTFHVFPYTPCGINTAGIGLGDTNGDGKLDVVVAQNAGSLMLTLFGNGDGTFQQAALTSFGVSFWGMAPVAPILQDVNGDGKLDLIGTAAGRIGVLLGNGDGTYQTETALPANQNLGYLGPAGDLNGDGFPDLVIRDDQFRLAVLAGAGNGFAAPVPISQPLSMDFAWLAAGDFNGDGRQDIAVASSSAVMLFLNNGDGTFQSKTITLSTSSRSYASGIVAADFNGDRITDLAMILNGTVTTLLGNGDGTFRAPVTTALALSLGAFVMGDFNGDGRMDLAAVTQEGVLPRQYQVLLGNGDGTFRALTAMAANANAIAAGDLNGDGKLDVAFSDGTFALGRGDGTFTAGGTFPIGNIGSTMPYEVQMADLNGDGRADVILSNNEDMAVYFGNADGTLQAPQYYGTAAGPFVVADFNLDGQLDIVGLASRSALFSRPANGAVLPVAVGANQAGLSFTADGVAYTTPHTFLWTVGSTHTVAWTSPQAGAPGTRYRFRSWGDGLTNLSRTVTIPVNATQLQGVFATQYQLAWSVTPAGAGGLAFMPPSTDYYFDAGSTVTFYPAAASGFTFVKFTGDPVFFSLYNSITMDKPHSITAVFSCSVLVAIPQSMWTVDGRAQTGTATVTAPDHCPWTAQSDSTSWLSVTSGASGVGNGTVTYALSANTSGVSRTGKLTVGTISYPITQLGVACTFSLAQTSVSVGAGLGTGSVALTASSSVCPWSADSDSQSWLQIYSNYPGTGSSTIQYRVYPNLSPQSRTGTLTVAGQTFRVTQAGAAPDQVSPRVTSVSPATSSGASQTLTVTFTSLTGYQNLDVENVLINTSLSSPQSCYLAYQRTTNVLYVVADNGDPTQVTGKPLGAAGTLGNSQCAVNVATSSATGSGNTLTLKLDLTFAPSFAGNKVVYAAARDLLRSNTGWQTMGVHQVPGATVTYPSPVSVAAAPNATSGMSQTFTFTSQDQSNAGNLQTAWMLINSSIDSKAACFVAYYRPGNLLYLYPDNGDGTQAIVMPLSGTGTLSNSQCTVSAQGASAQGVGNTLTVTLPITFTPGFRGNQGIWTAVQDMSGAHSDWQALGAWQVQ